VTVEALLSAADELVGSTRLEQQSEILVQQAGSRVQGTCSLVVGPISATLLLCRAGKKEALAAAATDARETSLELPDTNADAGLGKAGTIADGDIGDTGTEWNPRTVGRRLIGPDGSFPGVRHGKDEGEPGRGYRKRLELACLPTRIM